MKFLTGAVPLLFASTVSARNIWQLFPSEENVRTAKGKGGGCSPDNPRPVRDGQRFRFNLIDDDSLCVDEDDKEYSFGRFRDVGDVTECTDKCVNDTTSRSTEELRGVDYNHDSGDCDCLYDRNVLTGKDKEYYDSFSSGRGNGPVDGTTDKQDWCCYKLAGNELINDSTKNYIRVPTKGKA